MAFCPSCQRPVAAARATCIYCGAPLPAGQQAAAAPAGRGGRQEATTEATAAKERTLLVLALGGADPASLAEAVGCSRYEAELLVRRGGFHLHRVLEPTGAEAEAERLRATGVASVLVPEAEARLRPLLAIGGRLALHAITLSTEEGTSTLVRPDLLLVVSGEIARERRPALERRRVSSAGLEQGWRVHLHRLSDPRPLEIDALSFELEASLTGSTRLEIEAWLRELVPEVARDDGFRRLPPALGPAEPEPRGRLSAVASLRAGSPAAETSAWRVGLTGPSRAQEEPPVFDNAAQFRFYSGWRAAVERRTRAGVAR